MASCVCACVRVGGEAVIVYLRCHESFSESCPRLLTEVLWTITIYWKCTDGIVSWGSGGAGLFATTKSICTLLCMWSVVKLWFCPLPSANVLQLHFISSLARQSAILSRIKMQQYCSYEWHHSAEQIWVSKSAVGWSACSQHPTTCLSRVTMVTRQSPW